MRELPDLLHPEKTPKDLLLRSRCHLSNWASEWLLHHAQHGGHACPLVAQGLHSQRTAFQPAMSVLCLTCLSGALTTLERKATPFRRQFNEKPGIMMGCPALTTLHTCT